MADSQLILELLLLQRRGGCSLTVSKEHRNALAGSRLQFWIKLANVNESEQMAVTTARFQRDDHVI